MQKRSYDLRSLNLSLPPVSQRLSFVNLPFFLQPFIILYCVESLLLYFISKCFCISRNFYLLSITQKTESQFFSVNSYMTWQREAQWISGIARRQPAPGRATKQSNLLCHSYLFIPGFKLKIFLLMICYNVQPLKSCYKIIVQENDIKQYCVVLLYFMKELYKYINEKLPKPIYQILTIIYFCI